MDLKTADAKHPLLCFISALSDPYVVEYPSVGIVDCAIAEEAKAVEIIAAFKSLNGMRNNLFFLF
ncbi:hypothetical protein N8645_01330 [bacterium]|nr:hypothetical protein [bacterium]